MSVTLTSGSSASLDDMCTSTLTLVNTALIDLAPVTTERKEVTKADNKVTLIHVERARKRVRKFRGAERGIVSGRR